MSSFAIALLAYSLVYTAWNLNIFWLRIQKSIAQILYEGEFLDNTWN